MPSCRMLVHLNMVAEERLQTLLAGDVGSECGLGGGESSSD